MGKKHIKQHAGHSISELQTGKATVTEGTLKTGESFAKHEYLDQWDCSVPTPLLEEPWGLREEAWMTKADAPLPSKQVSRVLNDSMGFQRSTSQTRAKSFFRNKCELQMSLEA